MHIITNFRVLGARAGLLAAALQLLSAGCDADVGVMLNVGSDGEVGGGADDGGDDAPGFDLCGDGQLGIGEQCDLGADNGPGSACRHRGSGCQSAHASKPVSRPSMSLRHCAPCAVGARLRRPRCCAWYSVTA